MYFFFLKEVLDTPKSKLMSKVDLYFLGLKNGVPRPQPVSRGFMAYMHVGLFQVLYSFPCGGHTLCWSD